MLALAMPQRVTLAFASADAAAAAEEVVLVVAEKSCQRQSVPEPAPAGAEAEEHIRMPAIDSDCYKHRRRIQVCARGRFAARWSLASKLIRASSRHVGSDPMAER